MVSAAGSMMGETLDASLRSLSSRVFWARPKNLGLKICRHEGFTQGGVEVLNENSMFVRVTAGLWGLVGIKNFI